MEPLPQFGFKELFTKVIGDTAAAVCERFGESKHQQFVRTQAATHMILGLLPRDVLEAMLACQMVMFHALLTDSIHDTLQGQVDVMRRPTRSNIVAINRAFHMNLDRLEKNQVRPSVGTRNGTEQAGDRTPRTAAPAATPTPLPTAPAPCPPGFAEAPAPFHPSPEQIAACRANPEAMAALATGDAARFARALGVAQPGEAYLAAAAGLGGAGNGTKVNGSGNQHRG